MDIKYYDVNNTGIIPKSGIYMRRLDKQVFSVHKPARGEIVYATDTGEFGWLNSNGDVEWEDFYEDKISEVNITCNCEKEHILDEIINTSGDNYITLYEIEKEGYNSISYQISYRGSYIYGDIRKDIVGEYTGKFHIPDDLVANELWNSGMRLKGSDIIYESKDNVMSYYYSDNIDIEIHFLLTFDGIIKILLFGPYFERDTHIFGIDINLQQSSRRISKSMFGYSVV